MTTKRKLSQSTSKTGVTFVKSIVNDHNSIFQEIALENDIGNDAYIEFIKNEQATGYCIASQIKSGDSYVTSNGNFVLKSDKDHFEYWNSHVLPIAAIIYSPTKKMAVWCYVTEYLLQHPGRIMAGPYNIEISASQVFSSETFPAFQEHFSIYGELFKYKIGVALEKFADIDHPQYCLDGMKYLFSFQRDNNVTWYYVINCFQNFRKHRLLIYLISMIAHLPGHGDIFWHKDNVINEQTCEVGIRFLKKRFGRIEILCMLEVLTDGGGFGRGAVGPPVEAIVSQVKDREAILESIAFDASLAEDVRYWSLFLLVFYTQRRDSGIEECLKLIDKYQRQFRGADGETSDMVFGIREELVRYGKFHLFY